VRKSRYLEMAHAFGITAAEQLTCGCHVHVEISSAEEGVAVLDRIGPWLAVLLALSANSPFWQGRDTAYASFRYQAWGRWPTSGPAEVFGTAEAYRETVRQMVGTGTLLDAGMVYFDARLSEHYPTVEIRIADVCLHADDAVLIAALARALVDTAARCWRAGGGSAGHQRTELLRLAAWRASRSGLADVLLNPVTGLPEPAAAVWPRQGMWRPPARRFLQAGRVYWPRPVRSCNRSICLAASAFVSRSGGSSPASWDSVCRYDRCAAVSGSSPVFQSSGLLIAAWLSFISSNYPHSPG
jgi:hypothetical protein